jgi:hypothetical protein
MHMTGSTGPRTKIGARLVITSSKSPRIIRFVHLPAWRQQSTLSSKEGSLYGAKKPSWSSERRPSLVSRSSNRCAQVFHQKDEMESAEVLTSLTCFGFSLAAK